ncbi:lipopolysaccharide heptosyltransferase II, partial [bacterium]|nr:lipopolysaccharide heptosyltransferase II [bacterium]
MKIQNNNKILIIKLGSIGDVIHTLPIAEILKTTYPDCQIDWLVEKKSANLLEENPFITNLFVFERTAKNFIQKIQKIRDQNYDFAIDFQGTYKSQLFIMFSKAKTKIGYNKTKEKIPFSYNLKINLKTLDKHAVDRNIDLIKPLGITVPEKINFKIEISDQEKQNAQNKLKEYGINHNFCVISGSAGKPANRWDPLNFAELIKEITQNLNLDVILIGNKADDFLNSKIMISSNSKKAHNISGKLTLKETAYLLNKSQFIICGDTGPMHIAVAVNCPVIALFGGSNPKRTGPYQGKNIIIHTKTECWPCYKKECKT